MVFEIGKCYKHNTGMQIKILGEVTTHMRGKGLLAETYGSYVELYQVGTDEEAAVNWHLIPSEEFENNFGCA